MCLIFLKKNTVLKNGKKTGYGMGWGIIKRKKLKGFGHHGASVGGTTQFEVFPKEKLVFILIYNTSNTDYGNSIDRIVKEFIKNK
tara:strand:- start:6293 stop:6547 length:255 start_codon:yes stop_codon:yes gene_type:complete